MADQDQNNGNDGHDNGNGGHDNDGGTPVTPVVTPPVVTPPVVTPPVVTPPVVTPPVVTPVVKSSDDSKAFNATAFAAEETLEAGFVGSDADRADNVNENAHYDGLVGAAPYRLTPEFNLQDYLCCHHHPNETHAYVRTTADVHYDINYNVKHLYTILHEIECVGGSCSAEIPGDSVHQ